MIQLTRRYQFRAIHRLADPDGPDEGLHGHHYALEITVEAPMNEQSHWIADRDALDSLVREKVLCLYDKSDLNQFLPFTSGEYLAWDIANRLTPELGKRLKNVSLQETRKNLFYISGTAEGQQVNENAHHHRHATEKDEG